MTSPQGRLRINLPMAFCGQSPRGPCSPPSSSPIPSSPSRRSPSSTASRHPAKASIWRRALASSKTARSSPVAWPPRRSRNVRQSRPFCAAARLASQRAENHPGPDLRLPRRPHPPPGACRARRAVARAGERAWSPTTARSVEAACQGLGIAFCPLFLTAAACASAAWSASFPRGAYLLPSPPCSPTLATSRPRSASSSISSSPTSRRRPGPTAPDGVYIRLRTPQLDFAARLGPSPSFGASERDSLFAGASKKVRSAAAPASGAQWNEYINTFFDGVYIFCGRGPQLDWAAVRGLRQGRADGLSWLLTLVGLAPGAGIGSPR